jgi:hypothetical protein
VEVELTQDIPHWYDDGVWAAGSSLTVDEASAKSMVDKGVAKLVGAEEPTEDPQQPPESPAGDD